jgi:uncharacterized protein YoxC
VGVVVALSLLVVALSAIAVATAVVVMALGVRALYRVIEQRASPAVHDVQQLVATIKGEAEALVGTSRDIRLRIVQAADAAQQRLADLDAVIEVVQGEVEETVINAAAAVRDVRRGVRVWRWARRLLGPKDKRKRRRR